MSANEGPDLLASEQAKNITLDDPGKLGAAKQVFLCYCRQDQRAAERLQVHLVTAGRKFVRRG